MTQFCLLEQPWALLEVPETEFHEIEVFLEVQEPLMHAPIQATLLSLLFFLQSASPRCHSFIPHLDLMMMVVVVVSEGVSQL
jgi:hypothetical protein